ncbi:MAG: hypothetical protein IPG75_20805 [Gemmatimonadetes bacterium]|nr:hypothetical protein [Gemmatimonadota bacterium]
MAISYLNNRVNRDGFNPRRLLKEALRPVFETYAKELHEGAFPPPSLLERFGSTRLNNLTRSTVRRDDSKDSERRLILLDLWSESDGPVNLHPTIHQAFAIPPLAKYNRSAGHENASAGTGLPTTRVDRNETESQTLGPPAPPLATVPLLQRKLDEMSGWTAGGNLSQELTQELRGLVHAAVSCHLDWDANGLVMDYFAGASKPFRPTSVNFHRQYLQQAQTAIVLTLPLEVGSTRDWDDTALALEGLLRQRSHGNWSFREAGRFYRAYLRQVDLWSDEVLRQVRLISTTDPGWDPLPAAVEMLAIGARLSGRLSAARPTPEQVLSACFSVEPLPELPRSDKWIQLVQRSERYQDRVREIALAFGSCSKGSSKMGQQQFLDTGRILPVLEMVSTKWAVTETVPQGILKSYEALTGYQSAIVDGLRSAVETEAARLGVVYNDLSEGVGVTDAVATVTLEQEWVATLGSIQGAIAAARAMGMLRSPGGDIDQALVALEGCELGSIEARIRVALRTKDGGAKFSALAAVPVHEVARVTAGLGVVDRALAATTESLEREVDRLRSQGVLG